MVVDKRTLKIICLNFAAGSVHDFSLYKKSEVRASPHIRQQTDSGYQGIAKLHPNSEVPKKNTKKHKLTAGQKESNRALAKSRVYNEHVIGKLKVFNMLQNRYRNHRHFGKRFTLIAAIYNANLFM